MTPAINLAKKLGIIHTVHQYVHDPASDSFGLEAAEKLQVAPDRVFKTLVVSLDTGELVVAVVPVSSMLNMKMLARAVGARKAEMASATDVERSSGYVLGGVSPLGQRKRLKTIIDTSAKTLPTMFVSAGRRGLEIELAPDDLARSVNGQFADLCR